MSLTNKILEKKARRKRKLEKALSDILPQLIELGAIKVILFGSLAGETIDINSDLDLLVVMPAGRSGKEWQKHLYENVKRDTAADIFVYNEVEFKKYRESFFLQNVLNTGRIIYEKS